MSSLPLARARDIGSRVLRNLGNRLCHNVSGEQTPYGGVITEQSWPRLVTAAALGYLVVTLNWEVSLVEHVRT